MIGSFIWPAFLLLILLVPLLIAGYAWALRRRKRFSLNYSSLTLLGEAYAGQSHLLRHLPFTLLLFAFICGSFALARPTARIPVPSGKPTIVLALDVSLSMCANDIQPNRLSVAQEAAETFILNQEAKSKIALVAFAGFSELVVPPTEDPRLLLDAVDSLTTAPRTAIGSAILRSINAIAEINDRVDPTDLMLRGGQATNSNEGEMQPDIIVLLTDGESNRGTDPVNAAQVALDRGLRVYTIGFGTPDGARFFCTEEQLGEDRYSQAFGSQGGFFGGGAPSGFSTTFNTALDEKTLRQVADLTHAEFHLAESAEELLNVFDNIPANLKTVEETTEISAIFTSLGAIQLLLAFIFSQYWSPLP